MMKARFTTLLLATACALSSFAADRVSVSFSGTPLPTALRAIEMLAGDDVTVNFSFRKLEDYTVTTEIIDATPIEAISQAVGFYPIKVSLSGSVITVQPTLDTDYKVCGRLVNERGEGVDFASVAIVSLPDSCVTACGVSNLRGDFVIPVCSADAMVLKASRIGYKPLCVPAATGDMGDITIETDPQRLKTLTAYADRKMFSTVGAVTTVNVEGTPFSKIGTLSDLLTVLPGLSHTSTTFGLYGMGGTRYYINGREVSETTQLNMLRSDEVKAISIDKAPGAEYPADAETVVNISTVKSPEDFVNLRLNNTERVSSKLSDVPSVDLKMQLGKFTTALGYQYDYLLSQTDEDYSRLIGVSDNESNLFSKLVHQGKDKGSRLNWSGELQFSPRSRLGLYYYYYSLVHETSATGNITAQYRPANDIRNYQVQSIHYGTGSLHSGTLSYDYTGSRLSAHIAQDLAYTNPYSSIFTTERLRNEATSRLDYHDHEYFISTTNLRLGYKMPWGLMINAGGRLSYIESNSNKMFNANVYQYSEDSYGTPNSPISRYNYMNVSEISAQAYLTLSQRIGNVTISPGLRYDYVDRYIGDSARPDYGDGQSTQIIEYVYDRYFRNLLPSMMLKYSNGKLNMAFNYARRIAQPSFGMLNSGLVYEDNFTYSSSNPELRSPITDDFRLSGGYRGFSADLGYRSIKNPIAEVEIPQPNSAAVYRTPINLRRYREYDVNLAYASTFGALGYYASTSLVFPEWHGIDYSSQRITFNAEINLNYRFGNKLSLYTVFRHIGSCRWMVYDRPESQLWRLGANLSVMDRRLNINIEASDILNRSHVADMSTQYGTVTSSKYVCGDSRGVTFRVSYTLFNRKIRTSVKRGNVDDLDRITEW